MSKRFGRSRRRAAREKIASLEKDAAQLATQLGYERQNMRERTLERDRARNDVRQVVKAIEEIAPLSASIEPRLGQLRDYTDRIETMPPLRPLLGQSGPFDLPIGPEVMILNRLHVEIVADQVKKRCSAVSNSTGRTSRSSSRRRRSAPRAAARCRDLIIAEVARSLVRGLAKGLGAL